MKSLSIDRTNLIFGAALILGITIRFAPTLIAGFPLNDGGMFLSMIRDLHVSGYILPRVTSYNLSGIPLAYPPLGFYLARLLIDVGFPDIFLLRFLPACISSLAIYGVYLLTRSLIDSREVGAWTALIYALTPRSFAWLVMGGGLTRSLGFCFFLFAAWSVYQLFQEGSRKWLGLAILFSAITVLSHPEAAIHTVAFCIMLWFAYGRTWKSARDAVLVATGTLILSAPWWGTVLAYHGLDPFLSVIHSGVPGSVFQRFWLAIYPNDGLLPILPIMFLVGIVWGILNKRYLLLIWITLPCIIEPRSGIYIVLFPLSMLSGMLLNQIANYFNKSKEAIDATKSKYIRLVLFVFVIYLFMEGYFFGYRLVNTSLTVADRSAMEWARENTPVESHFILLTGNTAPELDAFSEWFPALAERKSLTTFQGTEWTLGPRFFANFREMANLQACANTDCLQVWITKNKLSFDYLLVRKKNISASMIEALRSDNHFKLIHEDDVTVVLSPQ